MKGDRDEHADIEGMSRGQLAIIQLEIRTSVESSVKDTLRQLKEYCDRNLMAIQKEFDTHMKEHDKKRADSVKIAIAFTPIYIKLIFDIIVHNLS